MYSVMSKEDTRNHILDTAIEQFWRKSYHGVNMNELSKAANVNKATVYQYFSSKEELVVAAVARAAQRSEEYVYQSTFEEITDPKERLKTIYQKVFQMHSELHKSEGKCRGCPFVNLGVELSTSSELIRIAAKGALDSFRVYYADIVENHWAAIGNSENITRNELVSSLLANMNGCLVQSKLENRPEAVLDGQARALRILGM